MSLTPHGEGDAGALCMGRRISDEQLLDAPVRRMIFERICEVPGIHLRQLQRDLNVSLGSLEYHLHRLVGGGLLVTRGRTHVKGYFRRGGFDRRDCDYLHFLRQRMPRRIVLEIVESPTISFQELTRLLPIGPSSTSFHLRRLVRAGIVVEAPRGRTKVYEVPEAERVKRLLLEYRSTFMDDVVDRFADAWLELEPPRRQPESDDPFEHAVRVRVPRRAPFGLPTE